jgi:hypothetical protein
MKSGYICERCKSFYQTSQEAIECELTHVQVETAEVFEATYRKKMKGAGESPLHRYPTAVSLRFGDWVATYTGTGGYSLANGGQRRDVVVTRSGDTES